MNSSEHANKHGRVGYGMPWFTLLVSSGTLICCALPIVLVTLGLGATVAAMTSSFPFLIFLSQHKSWIFTASAMLLGVSVWLMYRPGRACPTDPAFAALCEKSQQWNRRLLWVSVSIWLTGFTAAYLALPLRKIFEN